MIKFSRKKVVCFTVIGVISMFILFAGIGVLVIARSEECPMGCVEKDCLSSNYKYYACDCGTTCQSKELVRDDLLGLGMALFIIGAIGSILVGICFTFYQIRISKYFEIEKSLFSNGNKMGSSQNIQIEMHESNDFCKGERINAVYAFVPSHSQSNIPIGTNGTNKPAPGEAILAGTKETPDQKNGETPEEKHGETPEEKHGETPEEKHLEEKNVKLFEL